MGGRKPDDYPRNLGELYRRFHDDDACLRHLVETRWPAGFRCPKCDGSDGRLLTTRRVWVCRSCRHHASATAGTVLHRTRIPLTTCTHLSLSQAAMKRAGLEGDAVPGVHRVVSNLKTWLLGTHHGVGADHLDHYLNELVFRFNRRHYPMAGFARLLALGTSGSPTTAAEIRAPLSPHAAKRRRGRSTGPTTARRLRVEVIERS